MTLPIRVPALDQPSPALPRDPWSRGDPANPVTPIEAEAFVARAAQLGDQFHDPVARPVLGLGCQAAGVPDTDVEGCARGLARALGGRGYRRPLEAEEMDILLEAFHQGLATSLENGVMGLIAAVLSAPQLVYHAELGQAPRPGESFARPTPYELSSRLSYFLWAAPPDDSTVKAALEGRLATAEQISAAARRLLADPRGHSLPVRFAGSWLPVGDLADLDREDPTFTPAVRRDMRRELDRFVEHHFWETHSDLVSLLTAPHTFVTPALAAFYGVPRPGSDALTMVDLAPDRRGGLLTQGALMASLAWGDTPSAVRRGEFVLRSLLCRELSPPPPNVNAPLPIPFPQAITGRQRLEMHSSSAACAACHAMIDPLGFAFESFDATGRWRDKDDGLPVDASGQSRGLVPDFAFADAMAFAKQLATHPEVRACLADSWLQFALGRPIDPEIDTCSLELVHRRFAASGYQLRELVVAVTETEAFNLSRPRTKEEP